MGCSIDNQFHHSWFDLAPTRNSGLLGFTPPARDESSVMAKSAERALLSRRRATPSGRLSAAFVATLPFAVAPFRWIYGQQAPLMRFGHLNDGNVFSQAAFIKRKKRNPE